MARKPKPMKIRRYNNPMGSNYKAKNTAKTIAVSVVLIAIVGLVGYFVVPKAVDWVKNIDFTFEKPELDINSQSNIKDNSDVTSQDNGDNSQTSSQDTSFDTNPIPVPKQKIYYNASFVQLASQQAVDTLVSELKDKKATHCVITLKDENGNINYQSENEIAKQLIKNPIDIEMVFATLSKNEITPVVNITAFRDTLISTINRDTAIMYEDSDFRWLDSSIALGGKAWSNPANADTQEYLLDIVAELLDKGARHFIVSDFNIPTYGVVDKCDFNASGEQVLAHMKTLASTIDGRISAKGGNVSWIVDYPSFKNNDFSRYFINPLQIFTTNVIFKTTSENIDLMVDIPNIEKSISEYQLSSYGVWITDADANSDNLKNYFVM